MTTVLTARQVEVADAIYALFLRLGRTPTFHEIRSALGLRSSSTIYHHIRALEKKGVLRPQPGQNRPPIAFSDLSLQRLQVLIPEYLARGRDGEVPNNCAQEISHRTEEKITLDGRS